MLLHTERLTLRPPEKNDFDALCAILQDNDVMYAYNGAFSDDDVQQWLDKQLEHYAQHGFSLLFVIDNHSGQIIGHCGLTYQTYKDSTVLEIGYLFKKSAWHQGYAIEAATACKAYAFNTLHADKVHCIIRTSNRASIRVAKRLGMHCTDAYIKHYRDVDMPHYLFSVNRDEKLSIDYLANHPQHISTCASWAYGLWGSQSGGMLEGALKKFEQSAQTDAIPLSLIALYDGKPAGTISLWPTDHNRSDYSPWLAALYVHPFHRDHRISFALIERLIEESMRLGHTHLYLITETARPLYVRFGWTDIEEMDTPYGPGFVMEKKLNPS